MKENTNIKKIFKDPKNLYLKNLEYLKIYKMLKIGKFNLRPSLIKIDKIFIEIQNIYNDRFKTEILLANRKMNPYYDSDDESDTKVEFDNFFEFIYKNYLKKFKKINLAETKLINFLVSIIKYKEEFIEIKIFYDFLELKYDELDLSLFLFLRSLWIKELKPQILKFNKKYNLNNSCIDMILNNYKIKKIKCITIIENIFQKENTNKDNKIKNIFLSWISKDKNENDLFINELIEYIIYNYKEIRNNNIIVEKENIEKKSYWDNFLSVKKEINQKKEGKSFLKNANLNKNITIKEEIEVENINIDDEIINLQFKLINNLIESMIKENQIFNIDINEVNKSINEIIVKKLKEILKNIKDSNKILIFKNLMIEDANDEQLNYIEDLIIFYKELSSIKGQDNSIWDFSKKMLKFPEINDQISQLISHILSNIDN